ncbi:MAG: hypothetical protein EPN70_11545 [Paraburkholderia sp.]|uniref:hypothetical protein n=1 Tax=Paraburkholderia sp. TaxID=1926495 RepID=UPI001217D7F6|nr:hypothetical protein [Paraburkholderia sp.]TAM04432.1 MAG: hypothetical protein EPN70_11545 [Paraburkholderia sp.]TAM32796.1 MAG: hypothetical protein EPN59_00020 [Paraburkholderia sp.]
MGIGMQIVYQGFAGSSAIEAEAGVQLLRLERYSGVLSGCHLAIEEMHARGQRAAYDVRLDLISPSCSFKPIGHRVSEDPLAAMREAFDTAERELGQAAASARAHRHGATYGNH